MNQDTNDQEYLEDLIKKRLTKTVIFADNPRMLTEACMRGDLDTGETMVYLLARILERLKSSD